VAHTDPRHDPRDNHRKSDGPDRPEHAEVSSVPPPADRADRGYWKEDHHAASPERGNRAQAPAQPEVAMTPAPAPDRAHGRPAETMHDPHAPATTSAPPAVGRPQQDAPKPEAPKAKDEKAKGQKGKGDKDKEKAKNEG